LRDNVGTRHRDLLFIYERTIRNENRYEFWYEFILHCLVPGIFVVSKGQKDVAYYLAGVPKIIFISLETTLKISAEDCYNSLVYVKVEFLILDGKLKDWQKESR